jgi:hypothetical protein
VDDDYNDGPISELLELMLADRHDHFNNPYESSGRSSRA